MHYEDVDRSWTLSRGSNIDTHVPNPLMTNTDINTTHADKAGYNSSHARFPSRFYV